MLSSIDKLGAVMIVAGIAANILYKLGFHKESFVLSCIAVVKLIFVCLFRSQKIVLEIFEVKNLPFSFSILNYV